MGHPTGRALLIVVLALATGLPKAPAPPLPDAHCSSCPPKPRAPLGIYAVVPVETVVKTYTTKKDLIAFYTGLLDNPAVAGLSLQVHWDTLNPNPPVSRGTLHPTKPPNPYFWDYVDDAFTAVQQWDAANRIPPLRLPRRSS